MSSSIGIAEVRVSPTIGMFAPDFAVKVRALAAQHLKRNPGSKYMVLEGFTLLFSLRGNEATVMLASPAVDAILRSGRTDFDGDEAGYLCAKRLERALKH